VSYSKLRLTFEFLISLAILGGCWLLIVTPAAEPQGSSGAAAISTLVATYWFGRANARYSARNGDE
jgi:hypothetical protein